MTGINQANAEITLSLCAEMGTKNVLVSSHLGARYTDKAEPANHESWQGKIYTLSDSLLEKFGYKEQENKGVFAKFKEFFQKFRKKKSYEDFETVTGYGSIEGLCGINCRHTFEPFYPGMTNNQRQYNSEENKKAYDLSQKKRAMERQIRDTKKQLFEMRHAIKTASDEKLIAELKSKEIDIKRLFDKQNSAYSAFCGQNGLRRSEDRLYVNPVKFEKAEKDVILNTKETQFLTKEEVIDKAKQFGQDILDGKEKLNYDNGEPLFDYVSRKLGYDGLPQVVDNASFEKLAEKSPVGIIYRGITADSRLKALKYADEFKNGRMYAGKSYNYGHGTYFSRDKDEAEKYNNQGVMIRVALSSDTKIADYREILKEGVSP